MFRSFLKTAIRNLSKNKFFTILNVIGLGLGMSLSLLFIGLVAFLSRFDDFHADGGNIYRVTTQVSDKNENPHVASAPAALAENLRKFPGVEKVVRIKSSLYGTAVYADKEIDLGGYFADPGFFEVFSFPLLKGNKHTAINNPNNIVLSETDATRIFGDKEPIGQSIRIGDYGNFLVTGIFKDLPRNTHMQFGAIASYATLKSAGKDIAAKEQEGWTSFASSYVYMLLRKDADRENITRLLNAVAKERYAQAPIKAGFKLQALPDITPGPELSDPIGPNWSYLLLFITGCITLVVLVPACTNYINLSISQSLERMKEIGVRKVMGGRKKELILQFIVESSAIVLVALVLSYGVYEVIRRDFLGQMVETSPIDLSPTWQTFAGFLGFALLVGAVAGLIPALYFSKLKPTVALKGKEAITSGRSYFRNFVLTIQFILSLGFIMAVVIMMKQYKFSVSYDLGFEQEQLLDVDLQGVDPRIFRNEFQKLPNVQKISMSSHVPGVGSANERYIKLPSQFDSVAVNSMSVDDAFIANMNLTILAGGPVVEGHGGNARFITVNEELVTALHYKDAAAAINQVIRLTDSSEFRIAGVVKSFHYAGLKEAIAPFFFEYAPEKFAFANIKLTGTDALGNISAMEQRWKGIGGRGKFTAHLLSEEIKEAYSSYLMIVKLWGFLGVLAITVACMGLLGTVSFTIKKRVKEIGIRKVLGASAQNLVVLLSGSFVGLMAIASIITIPLMYLLFTNLLTDTQYYSISIGWLEIAVSLLIMLFFGLTTVLSQTLRAAHANPVENLKTE